MLRETLPTLKRTLLVTFKQNFLDKGLSQYIESFNESTLTLTWNNGSQIIFMSESFDTDKSLNRFRGLEINGAFIDEANEIQEETFNKVIERSGSWFGSPGCPTRILLTANPCNNWLKERFYDKYKEGTLPKGVAYLQARIFDNPHIPSDYLESLKMLPRYEYEQFVEGNWEISLKRGLEFYKSFELDKHIHDNLYNPELPLHISFDENFVPYFPAGIFQIEGKQLRMIDEIAMENPNNTVSDMCKEIEMRYFNHTEGMFIYGDATSRKGDVKVEKGYNLFKLILKGLEKFNPKQRVPLSNPSVVMRGQFINQIFYNNFEGIEISIGSNCKKTINDFTNVKEAPDGTKLKEKKGGVQIVSHFSDCCDYIILEAFKQEFSIYQRGGKVPVIRQTNGYESVVRNDRGY